VDDQIGSPHGQTVQCADKLQKEKKNLIPTSQSLQNSVSMLNVKVHDSRMSKRMNKYELFGRVAWESLFSLKRIWQHSLDLLICVYNRRDQSGDVWS